MQAGSLAVVDDESRDDRQAIEREMNENVLAVARHPEITFRSASVEAKPLSPGVFDVRIAGDLALHGVARRITVPARLEIREDVVHATGKVSLLQTEFGIHPTSAAAGTVKVADRVELAFDVVAAREKPSGR